MALSETPKSLKAKNTRENLARTAMELFSRYGVETVTIDDICARCGVTKGAFYHHFPSKDHIVTYAINRNMDQYMAETYHPEEGEPLSSRLLRLQHLCFAYFQQIGKAMTCLSYQSQARSLIVLKEEDRFYVQSLSSIIHEGIRAGVYTSRLSEEECYMEHIITFTGFLFKWSTTPDHLDHLYHWEAMLDELLLGLFREEYRP